MTNRISSSNTVFTAAGSVPENLLRAYSSAEGGRADMVRAVAVERSDDIVLAGLHAQASTDAAMTAGLSGYASVAFQLAQARLPIGEAMGRRAALVPEFEPAPYVVVTLQGNGFYRLTIEPGHSQQFSLKPSWWRATERQKHSAFDDALRLMGYIRAGSWQSCAAGNRDIGVSILQALVERVGAQHASTR